MDPEVDLMQRVQRLAGPYLAKLESQTPVAFWAALTANESGRWLFHDTRVPPRFEQNVYDHLMAVHQYGIPWGALTKAMVTSVPIGDLQLYASSWGLTQVMGYNALAWGRPLSELDSADTHYQLADRQMQYFVRRYGLDPAHDFGSLARCWNTGGPGKLTADPMYVENLSKRMNIWGEQDALFGDHINVG